MEMREDDGRIRTGTVWTATAHAVTAVIGSGVLALPWSVAQMGWIFGPIALAVFALITYYTSVLLSDCYRSPDPVLGKRNYTYMGAVMALLGGRQVFVCGLVQYVMLWGAVVGYTITSATSMMSIQRTNCFHEKGNDPRCGELSGNKFVLIFGVIEVLLSQLPNLEKITMLSVMAAIMSIAYSLIALLLSIVKFASQPEFRGSLTGAKIGTNGISSSTKVWNASQALGNIAFAYTYALLLIEIQDTLKSPPSENKTMKKASMYGLGVTTVFYVSLGLMGYVAFGNDVPGNILTAFREPFWLIDAANLAVIIHLIGAYQVYSQPIFGFYEKWLSSKWPSAGFLHNLYTLKIPFTADSFRLEFTLSKLFLRTAFVLITTLVAMMFPFFNAVLGLIGAIAFWPLTVHFPVRMYISQANIKRRSSKWLILQSLSMVSLLVSLIAAVGSIADIVQHLKHTKLFHITL
ncbi:hypothetical protein Syun_002985 [Stephania yunnanensis]|uniref:Amino acid transporter transmembrane domain-containing protein n=1 Tax=Stephania yunnanensis TaxID=152371 RepID=A0AAP0PZS0_9MAGN